MRSLFDPSEPVLTPEKLAAALTGKKPEDLHLPGRAVIVFTRWDISALVRRTLSKVLTQWLPYRQFYRTPQSLTVLVRSPIGGPALAALVEELAAFGAREFFIFGYCGGIGAVRPGDVILATAAIREDGVSFHYLEGEGDTVASQWASEWQPSCLDEGFSAGTVWTSDAIYRETADKVERYGRRGVIGVEMETASLYAVCASKGLPAASFLVVSDIVRPGRWESSFGTPEFRAGRARLRDFFILHVIE